MKYKRMTITRKELYISFTSELLELGQAFSEKHWTLRYKHNKKDAVLKSMQV